MAIIFKATEQIVIKKKKNRVEKDQNLRADW